MTSTTVTQEDIAAAIVSTHFFIVSDALQTPGAIHESGPGGWFLGNTQLMTICILQLRNGFTVTGESACAAVETFNSDIGRRLAREAAIRKVWPLLGYELRSKLAAAEQEET